MFSRFSQNIKLIIRRCIIRKCVLNFNPRQRVLCTESTTVKAHKPANYRRTERIPSRNFNMDVNASLLKRVSTQKNFTFITSCRLLTAGGSYRKMARARSFENKREENTEAMIYLLKHV